MITSFTIYTGNHTVAELRHLTDAVADTVETDATVTMTLYDREGVAVPGETWPVTMAHTTGGTYRAILDNQLAVVSGEHYTASIDVTTADMKVGHWEIDVFAQIRRG